ncbi:MAG: hypothetical protein ACERKD_03855 [Prolixibacteraceae bacterium]
MKRLVYLFVLLLTANWTFAQKDAANILPDSQIKVNKEYDEQGNLIRYDSTSVSSWSSDSTYSFMNVDSLENQLGFFFNDGFDQFFNDSSFFSNGNFNDVHKKFLQQNQHFFEQLGFGMFDSAQHPMFGTMLPFPDLDQMRKEMYQQFKQFFRVDSSAVEFKGVQ